MRQSRDGEAKEQTAEYVMKAGHLPLADSEALRREQERQNR
jgi:hypothetical protein